MKYKRRYPIILIFLACFLITACSDQALFDELAENRVKIIVKGTYESNNPREWLGLFPDDDSVDDYEDPEQVNDPTQFMLDIAELKISDGAYNQSFANIRETYAFPLSDSDSFFNGTGVIYNNDDMRPDFDWFYIKMYVRKMIFDSAVSYYLVDDDNAFNGEGNWTFNENLEVLFHEEDVYGFDFNQLQTNTYYDSLRERSDEINRIFPLTILIEDGFVFDNTVDETIIEIRLVIKNFIKKYEYDYYETYHYVRHYYALSDWLRDVKQASFKSSSLENYGNESIGGNIIAVARSYISGRTVTITGDAGDNNCHVVAITDNHDISEYEIDPADRTRPISSEEPKIPQQPVPNDLESILDYYLKLEKYKEDYDNFIDNIISGEYEDSWVEYDDRINSFRIPQLVTWVGDSDTTFTLTNVPAGKTYKIYRSATSINTGELPGEFIFVGNITADMDQAGTTISLQ